MSASSAREGRTVPLGCCARARPTRLMLQRAHNDLTRIDSDLRERARNSSSVASSRFCAFRNSTANTSCAYAARCNCKEEGLSNPNRLSQRPAGALLEHDRRPCDVLDVRHELSAWVPSGFYAQSSRREGWGLFRTGRAGQVSHTRRPQEIHSMDPFRSATPERQPSDPNPNFRGQRRAQQTRRPQNRRAVTDHKSA